MSAHSRLFLGSPSLAYPGKPGTYWVWFGYQRYRSHVAAKLAYAKLKILAPMRPPPLSLVVAHSTIRANSADIVRAVNRSRYGASTSGAALSPRTGSSFSPRNEIIVWDIPGNGVAADSTQRITQPIWSR